jgi:hypothetical protein
MSEERELVELKIDEANELIFKVTVEGESTEPAKARLVFDGGLTSYLFNGKSAGEDNVQFIVPALKNSVKEGEKYNGRIEVLVENRYFVPVEFDVSFKQPVRVVAEALRVNSTQRATVPVVKVSASQVVKQAPPAPPAPIVEKNVEQPIVEKKVEPATVVPEVKKPVIAKNSEQKKTVTGIDEATMREVALSIVKKLKGKI